MPKRNIANLVKPFSFEGTYDADGQPWEGNIQCLIGPGFTSHNRHTLFFFYIGKISRSEPDGAGELHVICPQDASLNRFWIGSFVGGEIGIETSTNFSSNEMRQYTNEFLANLGNFVFEVDASYTNLLSTMQRLSCERACRVKPLVFRSIASTEEQPHMLLGNVSADTSSAITSTSVPSSSSSAVTVPEDDYYEDPPFLPNALYYPPGF